MTFDRRTAVLGVAAAGAVAAALSVTLLDHASKGSPRRRAVIAYIDQVNAIENQMHAPLTQVLLAYRDFAAPGKGGGAAATELAAATATLGRLDRRLAAVPPPPEARMLRRLLLALVARQTAITREVQRLADFSPKFSKAIGTARAVNARLGAALAAVDIPKPRTLRGTRRQVRNAQRAFRTASAAAAVAQADAIDAYERSVAAILKRLDRLEPPRVLRPTYEAQRRAFEQIEATGARLATALRQAKRSNVASLGKRFALSSRIAQSTAAQRAQIAAVRRYNARARAVSVAEGRVSDELRRLRTSLP